MTAPRDIVYRNAYTTASTEMLRLLLKTSLSDLVKNNATKELQRRGEL